MTDEAPVEPTKSPLARIIKRVENRSALAQGFVEGRAGGVFPKKVPYRADQDTIDGAKIHFWIAPTFAAKITDEFMLACAHIAFRHIQAISFTWSVGTPIAFESYNLMMKL